MGGKTKKGNREMNTNQNEEMIVINLKDMAILFLKRLWLILLAAIIVGGACFAWLTYTYEEEYTSKATIFLYYNEGGQSVNVAASYLEISLYVLNDCEQILTSRLVINKVIDEITSDLTLSSKWRREVGELGYNGMKNSITISNVADSRVMEIAMRSSDPKLSKLIVDKICSYGAEEIENYLGFKQVSIIDEGTLNRHPSNSVNIVIPIAAAILAGLLVFAIALIIKMTDNKINHAEDVEKYLDLTVLGEIPATSSISRGKKYY